MANVKSLTSKLELGNMKSIGAGELVQEVYYAGHFVGEIHGVNGTQLGEEAYMPTLEEWVAGLSPKRLDEISSLKEEEVKCPICGEILYVHNARYEDENPNASSAWYDQLESEHALQHERENNYNEILDGGVEVIWFEEDVYECFGHSVVAFKRTEGKVLLLDSFGDIHEVSNEKFDVFVK